MMPAFTTANLLAWSIQAAVIVLVGGGTIYLARLRSPRVRLACFQALLVACLLLPFLAVTPNGRLTPAPTVGPADLRAVGSAQAPGAPVQSVDVTPADASGSTRSSDVARTWLPGWVVAAVVVVLGVGIAARLGWLLIGLIALRRLRRDARAMATGTAEQDFSSALLRAIHLAGAMADTFTSAAVRHPVTFGLRHPVVLLPETYASLDETEQVAVLCHELLHVRRRDWLYMVAEEIVRAILWFHPAIWWLLARIDLSREQLIDQQVVALTERRQPYLKALVTLAATPAGPILWPAALFLGRAHLLQRVALLSREVRMSWPRLVVSLALVTAALVAGGQFVVRAFPLTALAPAPTSAMAIGPRVPTVTPKTGGVLPVAANASLSAGAPWPAPQNRTHAEVLQRIEPVVPAQPSQPGADTILTMEVTIQPTGELVMSGPVEMFGTRAGSSTFEARASSAEAFQQTVERGMIRLASGSASARIGGTEGADEARAAFDAVRIWQFAPAEKPFTTVIGFNFARGEQSGVETQPVRIGGSIAQPKRLRNVVPSYPSDAQARGIQGVVILELVLDGAGIPISAYAVRPVEGLTMAAVRAALQWRYEPDATYSRRLMTVTVNFTLGGVTGGIVAGSAQKPPPPPPPPPPDAVSGGVRGGVSGGIEGGVIGGVVGGGVVGGIVGPASFGPARSEWPSNALRVGGNIKQPTRVVNVDAIYPPAAQQARVQGVVIVEVLVGADGKVQAGQILRSIPMLDQAALDAVKQWEYMPTLLNGTPVPLIMALTVNFTLS